VAANKSTRTSYQAYMLAHFDLRSIQTKFT